MTHNTISLYDAAIFVYDSTQIAKYFCGENPSRQFLISYHLYHLIELAKINKISINGYNNSSLQVEKIDAHILRKSILKDNDSLTNKNGNTIYINLHCNLDEIRFLIDELNHFKTQKESNTTNDNITDEWIKKFQKEIVHLLVSDKRFINCSKILVRFNKSVDDWNIDQKNYHYFKAMRDNANELCAALEILKIMKENDILEYEPRLINTRKSIDFLIKHSTGQLTWIDVKTIAPLFKDNQDNWERTIEKTKDSPSNAQWGLDQKFCGAGIGGVMLNCRWSFIQRTKELEDKITLLADSEKGSIWLLFCSEGLWYKTDLEDFADFYQSSIFREDDPAQNAVKQYMLDNGIVLSHNINGFCYLERRHGEVFPRNFTIKVRGPILDLS